MEKVKILTDVLYLVFNLAIIVVGFRLINEILKNKQIVRRYGERRALLLRVPPILAMFAAGFNLYTRFNPTIHLIVMTGACALLFYTFFVEYKKFVLTKP